MDLEQKAIERLRFASETSLTHYDQPLMLAYSGGKDSDTILELALRAGIPVEVQHSHTTADAPETVRYVRGRLYNLELQGLRCSITYPAYKGKRVSMWTLIPQKLMPPTRKMRYCCEICKEAAGAGRAIATGVRWAESGSRKERGEIEALTTKVKDKIALMPQPETEQLVLSDTVILGNDNDDRRRWMEHCQMRGEVAFNPIIDWPDRAVWEYLHDRRCKGNPCYSRYGLTRVGCVGCPMAGNGRYKEFAIWPQYRVMYLHAFSRMLEARKAGGKIDSWKTAEDVMAWYMQENPNQELIEGWEG